MDMNDTLKNEIINVSRDRLRMYKIMKQRCLDQADIVKFCDFQIEVLQSIIGI